MTDINCNPDRYDSLSDDELEELLHQEMHSEDDLDGEVLREIGKALDSRAPRESVDAQDSWAKFAEKYLDAPDQTDEPEKNISVPPKKRRRILRFAITAAVIVGLLVGITMTVSSLDKDFFDVVFKSGKERLEFRISSGDAITPADASKGHVEVPEELKPMQEALEERGITASLLPTYLPDGYVALDLESSDSENGHTLSLPLQKDGVDELLDLNYVWYETGDIVGAFEKDDKKPVVYTVNGTSYYIMTNAGELVAAWTCGKISCSIFGAPNEEELYKMLDSIP